VYALEQLKTGAAEGCRIVMHAKRYPNSNRHRPASRLSHSIGAPDLTRLRTWLYRDDWFFTDVSQILRNGLQSADKAGAMTDEN